jgi:hypothetical protein
MLAEWIFFKPSRFKHYLHQADPGLYFGKGVSVLLRAFSLPAYRNLLPIAVGLILVLTVPVVLVIPTVLVISIDWTAMALGIFSGMGSGMLWSMLLISGEEDEMEKFTGLAPSVIGGVAGSIVGGVVGGLVGGMAVKVSRTMTLSLAFSVTTCIAGVSVQGNAAGAVLGAMWSVGWGMVLGVVVVAIVIVRWTITRVMAWDMMVDVILGTVLGVLLGVGGLRIPFYLVGIGIALFQSLRTGESVHRLKHHPAVQDELAILPFPGLIALLTKTLENDWTVGIRVSHTLLRNPFQRWAVRRAFSVRWRDKNPLPDLYQVLQEPWATTCTSVPVSENDLITVRSRGSIWLSEVAGIFVDPHSSYDIGVEIAEWLAWQSTHLLQRMPKPKVAPLAHFLLYLEIGDRVRWDESVLTKAKGVVKTLPHGEEIAESLVALSKMTQVKDLEGIVRTCEGLDWLTHLSAPPLRPRVIEGLRGMLDIAVEINHFLQTSSPAVQAGALSRAIGMLEELESYTEDILVPERHLLRLGIDHWQSLVAKAAGQLGDRSLREIAPSTRRTLGLDIKKRYARFWSRPAQPFPNPYKTGDPVYPPLFVGRGDIFNRLQEVWEGKANPDSIILYGHRRMGKSSILRNLGDYAPKGSLLVYVDLKGETAFAQSTRHLLRALAEEVTWSAQDKGLDLPEPDPADYTGSAEASQTFKQFLRRTLQVLPGEGSLILALDEFEAVDVAVREGKIGREIYDYLRTLSQEPCIVLVFAGLHTLDEMSRDYQEAFFDSYVNLPVSYLPPEAAERLIARPTSDFALSYHPDVIAQVIKQTHGQPLLVQRICQELVNHINHELFDLDLEREARVLPEDLAAVMDADFVRSETRYFEGIWNDQIAGQPAVAAVLEALTEGPASVDALTQATRFTKGDISEALEYLETRDLVARDEDGQWNLLVPLMRRWLRLQGR